MRGVSGKPLRPLTGTNTVRNDMKQEKSLKRLEISGLEKKALELRVKVTLQSLVSWGKDGDIVFADSVLKGGQEEGFLNKLRELGIMGVKKSNEDRVGVDLRRVGGRRGLPGQCRRMGMGREEEERSEEEDVDHLEIGEAIDVIIHGSKP